MTDLALLIHPTRILSPSNGTLGKRVSTLTSRFSDLWNRIEPLRSPIGRIFSATEQNENESKVREILPERSYQRVSRDQAKTQILRMKNGIRDLVLESITLENREEISGFLHNCFDAGDEFAHRARDFDADLRSEGIFQALRNLWIINSIQAGFGMPVRLSPSALAYSLLYTYTDNFLDDKSISLSEKGEFGVQFGRRLAGLDVDSDTPLLSKVSDLVGLIEEEYARDSYPEVYASLLAIHRAQQDSLQQRGDASPDIRGLSVQKGGTSVLADGCLVKGVLSSIEQEFCFGYGVFLQLIDDLQDVEEDLTEGSQTLFTRAVNEGALDDITTRLAAYVRKILRSAPSVIRSKCEGLTELILQGSNGLILESVALHPLLFSKKFVKTVEPFSPLTFEAIRSIHEECASLDTTLFLNQDHIDSTDLSLVEKAYCS